MLAKHAEGNVNAAEHGFTLLPRVEKKKIYTPNKHKSTHLMHFFFRCTVSKTQDDKTAATLGEQLQVKAATYSRLDLNTHGSFRAKHTHLTPTEHGCLFQERKQPVPIKERIQCDYKEIKRIRAYAECQTGKLL